MCKLCNNEQHRLLINSMYKQIISVLQTAAISSHNTFVKSKNRFVARWNKHVKGAHARAWHGFQKWILHGKPALGDEKVET